MRARTLVLTVFCLLAIPFAELVQAQITVPGPGPGAPGPGAPGPGAPGPGAPGPGGPPAPTGPGAPPPRSTSFDYTICNKSTAKNAYAAVAGKIDATKWQVAGWYKIPDAGCALIGKFEKDVVYILVFADGDIEWGGEQGKDPALCASRTKAFNYTTGDGGGDAHQCDAANEEVPTLFRPIKVNTAGSVWTTNLTVNP